MSVSLFLCGYLAIIKNKVCRHNHIHRQSSTSSFCYPVTHTPFSLNTWNSHWDFTLLNKTASLCLSKSISILRAGFLFLNFHVRNMRWWMENEMMRNMFPYWFDCRYDGINHALALADCRAGLRRSSRGFKERGWSKKFSLSCKAGRG